jgi:hypothetical protein
VSGASGSVGGGFGRRHIILIAVVIVVVAIVLVAALVLYSHSSSASVTVTGAVATLEEGKTSGGVPWFGQGQLNYTTGFPLTLGAGGTFTLSVPLANDDSVPHSVVAITANTPFKVTDVSPSLPAEFDAFEDGTIVVTVQTPGSAGSFALSLTVVCQ